MLTQTLLVLNLTQIVLGSTYHSSDGVHCSSDMYFIRCYDVCVFSLQSYSPLNSGSFK